MLGRVRVTAAILLTVVMSAPARQQATDGEPWLRPYVGPERGDVDATTLDDLR